MSVFCFPATAWRPLKPTRLGRREEDRMERVVLSNWLIDRMMTSFLRARVRVEERTAEGRSRKEATFLLVMNESD